MHDMNGWLTGSLAAMGLAFVSAGAWVANWFRGLLDQTLKTHAAERMADSKACQAERERTNQLFTEALNKNNQALTDCQATLASIAVEFAKLQGMLASRPKNQRAGDFGD